MDIIDIERKAEADENKMVLIFNPLNVDFQGKYDGEELPEYLIPSKENKKFKTSLANHFGDNLVDLYLNTKGLNYPRDKARKMVFS